MENRFKLEEKSICSNCTLSVFITDDEQNYILQINYRDRFISEKIFTNDMDGVANMEEAKNLYKNENDIKQYFGIF
jgi:hypothetical protein